LLHCIKGTSVRALGSRKVATLVRQNKVEDCFLLMVKACQEEAEIYATSATPSEPNDMYDTIAKVVPGDSLVAMQLRTLLMEKAHLFKTDLTELPPPRAPREVIHLVPGAAVPNRPMFRYSKSELEEMQRQVGELLKNGLLQKSTSPFGAPVLFVNARRRTARYACAWTTELSTR